MHLGELTASLFSCLRMSCSTTQPALTGMLANSPLKIQAVLGLLARFKVLAMGLTNPTLLLT